MSLPRYGIRSEYTQSTAGTAGEWTNWMFNTGELWDGTSRLIVALHGHGTVGQDAQGCLTFNQNTGPGAGAMALARTGRYVICSIQAAGAASWSGPAAQAAIASAITAARTRGVKAGKYGILGWSMGGLETANRIKRDAANIAAAWTWAPAIDLDYIYSTAGHNRLSNNATWKTEVDTAFGSYAATAGYRVYDEPLAYRGLGVKWKIAHATDDGVIPYGISSEFVAAVGDPNISLRQPNIMGDHTNLFQYIPDAEIVSHFDSGVW